MSLKKIESFVYFRALITGINEGKSDTPIRVDQCASALAILGHLADCDYYKKITNVFNNQQKIETYEIVGKEVIFPTVKKLIEK